MNMVLTKKEVRDGMKNSLRHGYIGAVRDGVTDNYVTPLALAVGAGNGVIGLINSVPTFFSMMTTLFSSKFIKKMKSVKKASLSMSFLNRLVLIPLIFVPFFYESGVWIILTFLSLYYILSEVGDTAWTCWVAELIPEKIRGKFFGTRNMLSNLVALITTFLVGWFLQWINDIRGFSIVFAISIVFGLISYIYFRKIPDVEVPKSHPHFHFSFMHFLGGVKRHRNYSNFVVFRMFMQFAVQIASPFIIVYMLRDLNIGYFWFAFATAAYILANVLSQKYWGLISDRYGDSPILKICTLITPFTMLFWMIVYTGPQAVLLQIFNGFVWSGFNLANFNYLLDTVPKEESPIFIANYRFLTQLGMFVGPIAGGLLADYFTEFSLFTFSGMQLLFLLSFILMSAIIGVFLPRFEEVRVNRKNIQFKNMILKVLVIYPIRGALGELKHLIHYSSQMK